MEWINGRTQYSTQLNSKPMPRKQNCSESTADNLLHSLRVRGGSAPLHSLKYSNTVIQLLVDRGVVKVINTGGGFSLEIVECN